MKDLNLLATEARTLKDNIEIEEAKVKTMKHRRDEILKKILPEAMELAEIDKFHVEGVGTVFLKQNVFVNVRKEDRDKCYAWFRENGLEDLVVDYVWPGTQKAWVKERLESGDEVPDFFNASFSTEAQLRKS